MNKIRETNIQQKLEVCSFNIKESEAEKGVVLTFLIRFPGSVFFVLRRDYLPWLHSTPLQQTSKRMAIKITPLNLIPLSSKLSNQAPTNDNTFQHLSNRIFVFLRGCFSKFLTSNPVLCMWESRRDILQNAESPAPNALFAWGKLLFVK